MLGRGISCIQQLVAFVCVLHRCWLSVNGTAKLVVLVYRLHGSRSSMPQLYACTSSHAWHGCYLLTSNSPTKRSCANFVVALLD